MEHFLIWIESEVFLMPTWKWVSFLLFLFLFPFIRRSLELALRPLKTSSFLKNNKNLIVSEISKTQIEIPVSWIATLLIFLIFVDISQFPHGLSKYSTLVAQILIGFRLIQILYIAIDVTSVRFSNNLSSDDSAQQIIPFAIKSIKAILLVLGILVVLQNLGINVVSLLAGLGIGGLAIALAGQETIANLFGSLTILMDRPFKINDHIKFLDVEGTVVEIGFRSTKVKTLVNSIVTIPNSTLAKEKLENMTLRDRRRVRHVVNLAYETPTALLKQFIEEVQYYLKSAAHIHPEDQAVYIIQLGAHSIDVQITYFVATDDVSQELISQQEFLLNILEITAKLKIEIPYPTQKFFHSYLPS